MPENDDDDENFLESAWGWIREKTWDEKTEEELEREREEERKKIEEEAEEAERKKEQKEAEEAVEDMWREKKEWKGESTWKGHWGDEHKKWKQDVEDEKTFFGKIENRIEHGLAYGEHQLDKVQDYVGKVTKNIQNYGENLMGGLTSLGEGTTQLMSGFGQIGTAVGNVVSLEPFQAVGNLGAGIFNIPVGAAKTLSGGLRTGAAVLPVVAGLGLAGAGISAVKNSEIYQHYKERRDQHKSESALTSMTKTLMNKEKDRYENLIKKAGEKIDSAQSRIIKDVENLGSNVTNKIEKAYEKAGETVSNLLTSSEEKIYRKIKGKLENMEELTEEEMLAMTNLPEEHKKEIVEKMKQNARKREEKGKKPGMMINVNETNITPKELAMTVNKLNELD